MRVVVDPSVTCGAYNYYDDTLFEDFNGMVNVELGTAEWSQDPCDGDPGDALRAIDSYPDGFGINAHLSTGRVATTAGHNSPYSSLWVTGNLPEDHEYQIWVCKEKGGVEFTCSEPIQVFS